MIRFPLALAMVAACATTLAPAHAANVTYVVDPAHTYPSFEADHMGISTWRGKFDKSSGTITMDRAASTGTVSIQVETGSVDFGLGKMNEAARTDELLDTNKYPTADFKGKLEGFDKSGKPARAVGTLTLHGVKKPVTMEIRKFKCMPHPMFKREMCGADAYVTINREDFGMTAGKEYGFDMNVELRIQVEAIAVE
jgi:polyisoprenoid-binding protein YceI